MFKFDSIDAFIITLFGFVALVIAAIRRGWLRNEEEYVCSKCEVRVFSNDPALVTSFMKTHELVHAHEEAFCMCFLEIDSKGNVVVSARNPDCKSPSFHPVSKTSY